MKQQKLKLLGSTMLAAGLGMWGAACTTTENPQTVPASGATNAGGVGTPTAAATNGGATNGAATNGSATGGAVTGNTVGGPAGGTVTGTTGAAAVTGVGGATASAVTGDTASSTTGTAPACGTPPAPMMATLIDFETYDGASAVEEYGVVLHYDNTTMVGSYAGAYGNTDETGTPEFGMVAGNAGSLWAVRAANAMATMWGGGVGFWIDCPVDVSAYTGISLAVRGSSPEMMARVSLTGSSGAGFGTSIPLTDTFTVQQLPFTGLMSDAEVPVAATAADFASLSGVAVGATMTYVDDGTGTFNPAPGAYEVVVDDVVFY